MSTTERTNSVDTDAEDVNDFLQRIKELGAKRDQEDEERNRKLEEEILQGRKERQARREERARSISPIKSSPANTPPHNPYRKSQVSSSDSPRFQAKNEDFMTSPSWKSTLDDTADCSSGTTKENAPTLSRSTKPGDTFETVTMQNQDSNPPSPRSSMPVRELSWQRRPKSQASERSRSRPLSQVATENASAVRSPTSTPNRSSADDKALSRDQIAQSLASKDPAFFRQTADRGTNSAAYRKTQVEDAEVADHSLGAQLPGMSRQGAERTSNSGTDSREVSPGKGSPTRSSRSRTMPSSILNMDGAQGTRSPMPMSPAQRLDPPRPDTGDNGSLRERTMAMSPSQGRISPERVDRPLSPTKGMGGFVQSAMMKRSDSVNKRWSVTSPQGLNRTNSTVSNRSSYHPSTSSSNFGDLLKSPPIREPTPLSREHTPRPLSRPTSSYGGSNTTVIQNEIERSETPMSGQSSLPSETNDVFVKPIRPATRSIQNSAASSKEDLSLKIEEPKLKELEIPASPSRTTDSRRWSPTKASWLESALNKPEPTPKPKAAAPSQPSWMAEIAKARQKSVDGVASKNVTPKHEVKVGGLMRSPAMGVTTKPLTLGGLPTGFGSPSLRSPEALSRGVLSPTKTGGGLAGQVDGRASPRPASSVSKAERPPSSSSNMSPPGTATKTSALRSPELNKSPSPALGKVKPETPPKKDFRANLKPRQPPPSGGDKTEAEFKSVFGQLKRTKTQNFAAPDELKDNILRGKSALNATGGPKKTDRVDEFKESILKKKKDFEKAQIEGKGVTRTASSASKEETVPEAIAKRKALALERKKSPPPSTPPKPASIKSTERTTPEALVKARAVRGDASKPSVPLPQKQASAPGQLQASGKLADRFNPALAGLLARGPPSAASETSRASSPLSQRSASQGTSADTEAEKPGPKLEHMTKSRARGPRRKAPSSLKKSTEDEKEVAVLETSFTSIEKPAVTQKPAVLKITSEPEQIKEVAVSKQDEPEPTPSPSTSPRRRTMTINRRSRFLEELANKNEKLPEPTTPKSPIKKLNIEEMFQASPSPTKERAKSPVRKLNHEFLPKNPSKVQEIEKHGDAAAEVKINPISTFNTSTITKKKLVTPPKSPELTKNALGNTAKMSAKPEPVTKPDISPKPIGLGIQSVFVQEKKPDSPPKPTFTRPASNVPAPISISRPKTPSSPTKPSQTPLSSASPSKRGFPSVPQSSEASKLLREFFGEPTSLPPSYEIDTTTILMNKPATQIPKMDTISCKLYQLAVGGKKTPVPQSLEKTLFEGNLYLCVHDFKTPSSNAKATEVYLWIGDEVADLLVQDGEAFASREAKALGGKLVVLYQGRECPMFFHALGGVVITRRGTSNKYDSLAPYILCGRQYLGSIAFDEVEFSPNSFCSGFPYLVNSQSAKIWLWKGKGSAALEINHARSLGEELGVMGDMEEVEEGSEPDDFLKVFGDGKIRIRGGAGHWKLKTNYPGYCGRLFKIEVTKVTEISPFTQTSIYPHNIHVLDAFFEIYIIIGAYSGAVYPGASTTAYSGGSTTSPTTTRSMPFSLAPSTLPATTQRSVSPFHTMGNIWRKTLTSFSTDDAANQGNQYQAFHTALHFAQEYGILAAGMEDRPFVPVSTVVVEGMPRDARVVVRKWKDGVVTTRTPDSGPVPSPPTTNGGGSNNLAAASGSGLQRGRSLRVVPLMAALEATRGP